MARRIKFPIRFKLLTLIGVATAVAIVGYLAFAMSLFKEDKTQLIYELNASQVETLAAQIQVESEKYIYQSRLFLQAKLNRSWIEREIKDRPEIHSFALFQLEDGKWALKQSYGMDRKQKKLPWVSLAKNSQKTDWNLWEDEGESYLILTHEMKVQGQKQPWLAALKLRTDRWRKLFEGGTLAQLYWVNGKGELLGYSEGAQQKGISKHPFLKKNNEPVLGLQVKHYFWEGDRWLGTFKKIPGYDLFLFSQVREDQIYRASSLLLQKSALFGILLLTLALGVTTWLSRSWTQPVDRLVQATEKLVHWNFTERIEIKSRDEIGQLADAFNWMGKQLSEQKTEIDRHQEELEQKVKERTSELADQKRKAAEAQDALLRTTRLASLGEVAGITAHEVLNPVNNMNIRIQRMKREMVDQSESDEKLSLEIIHGWKKSFENGGFENLVHDLSQPTQNGDPLLVEDLSNLEGILEDQQKRKKLSEEMMVFLQEEIEKITRIVNNMRSMARVKGERSIIPIEAPIESTLTALEDFLEKQKIQCHFEKNQDGLTVFADHDELVQVFSNLIRNASQAISERWKGNPEGKIWLRAFLEEGKVKVRVEDNGNGISEEVQNQIFEPDFTTKGSDQGTGLGLSISRRLVRAFDGDLTLEESIVGRGTIFVVEFPFKSESES